MRPRVLLVTATVVAAVLVGVVAVAVARQPAEGPPPPARSDCAGSLTPNRRPADVDRGTLVWSDEFNGAAGAPPDPQRWLVETGGLGWGEGELQAYTDAPANLAKDGAGNLVITARREDGPGGATYTSARLNTCGRLELTHGRVEARIKLPRGQGLWPAFWLVGADGDWPRNGEIDIVEGLNQMDQVHFNVHQPTADGTDWELPANLPQGQGSPRPPRGGTWADTFHVFAVDWRPGAVSWSIDGTTYLTSTRADTPPDGTWVLDDAAQMIVMNVAVGGWPGTPDDTVFPATMTVDYVRAYAGDATTVRVQGTGADR